MLARTWINGDSAFIASRDVKFYLQFERLFFFLAAFHRTNIPLPYDPAIALIAIRPNESKKVCLPKILQTNASSSLSHDRPNAPSIRDALHQVNG